MASVTDVEYVWTPPLPVFPRSDMPIVRATLADASDADVYETFDAAMNALRFVMSPASVRFEDVPPTVTPPPLVALRTPDGTARLTDTLALPASTSLTRMPVSGEATSSVTLMLAGAVMPGASFTAVTDNVTVVDAICGPPPPAWPPSSAPTFSVTIDVLFWAVVNWTPDAAKKALMSVTDPFSVIDVDVPPTVTPPTPVAERVPDGTDSITVIGLPPASASEKEMPASVAPTSSVTAMEPGAVMIGASLTGVMVTVDTTPRAAVLSDAPLSVMPVIVTTRLPDSGLSVAFAYASPSTSPFIWPFERSRPKSVTVAVPAATDTE